MGDLHFQKDILKIERIQNFVFLVCSKKWTANYGGLLDDFHSSTLYGRRKFLQLCTFCIFNASMSLPSPPIFTNSSTYYCRCCNNIHLLVPHSHFTAFQNSFFVETIESWNNLLFDMSSLSSLSTFKFLLNQECRKGPDHLLRLNDGNSIDNNHY